MAKPEYLTFFDTETSDKLDFKKAADAPGQGRLASLAWILTDFNGSVLQSCHLAVSPDGWQMSEEASKINGWTDDALRAIGYPVRDVLGLFNRIIDLQPIFIAHSATFDAKIVRGELRRLGMEDRFMDMPLFCTMVRSVKTCRILGKKPRHPEDWKWPTLDEAYQFFTGREMRRKHSAMADTYACMEIFWGLMERGVELDVKRPGTGQPRRIFDSPTRGPSSRPAPQPNTQPTPAPIAAAPQPTPAPTPTSGQLPIDDVL